MKLLSIILGFIIILGVGGLVFIPKNSQTEAMSVSGKGSETNSQVESSNSTDTQSTPTTPSSPTTSPAPVVTSTPSGISANVIAAHNTRSSCWSSINGSVYDLTSWIPNHPGGEKAILQLCGIDGSQKFNSQHGGGEKQLMMLSGFKIGVLAQ